MNICMVTLDNPLNHLRDGISIHVYELSKALVKKGCTVWIVGFDKNIEKYRIIKKDGITFYCIPSKGSNLFIRMIYFMKYIPQILEKLNIKENIDIFHGHGGYAGPIALNRSPGKKVATIHSTSEDVNYHINYLLSRHSYKEALAQWILPPQPILKIWRKWYYGKMDMIISVSGYNTLFLKQQLKLVNKKLEVIPNGVNYEYLTDIKNKLKIPCKKNTILYFGRLDPNKGVQVLLNAMPSLLERYPDLKLNIAGEGVFSTYLKKQAVDLKVNNHVEFKGFLSGEKLIGQILGSTVVVIPSFYEGVPLTLLESMALGKAVIASNLPGISEIVRSDETGLLVPPGDSACLAEAISRMLEDSAFREKICKNAEGHIKDNFTWEVVASKTIKAYEELSNE